MLIRRFVWYRFRLDSANHSKAMPRPPKLLVSVRNVNETVAAIQGGADIVDVKEPANGSLGRANNEMIAAIATTCRAASHSVPLSIALGEACDWDSADSDGDPVAKTVVEARADYLKLGLANARRNPRDWQRAIGEIHQSLAGQHRWVAVAYADFKRADSPSPIDVCRFAIRSKAAVLLIDTFRKDGTNLMSWVSREQLKQLRSETAARGIQLALAGKVTQRDLMELTSIGPDIVAVRGAVCEHGDRVSAVSELRVREFKEAMTTCD